MTAYIILILLVVGFIVILMMKPDLAASFKDSLGNGNKTRRNVAEEEKQRLRAEVESLRRDIAFLQHKIGNIEMAVNGADRKIANLENYIREIVAEQSRNQDTLKERIVSHEKELGKLRNTVKSKEGPPPIPQDARTEEEQYPKVCYAPYPDKEIFGFRDSLISEGCKDAIYEITLISPDKATYRLIDDHSVRSQLFLMMNSVVEPFCEIIISSDDGNLIKDVSPGELRKLGDNWIIQSKATIEVV